MSHVGPSVAVTQVKHEELDAATNLHKSLFIELIERKKERDTGCNNQRNTREVQFAACIYGFDGRLEGRGPREARDR